MTDRDIPPDGFVRTALQLLPIPAHGDDFWDRLEASLDDVDPAAPLRRGARRVLVPEPLAGPAPSAPVPPEPVRSVALVPPAFRRGSNAVLAAVAVAAAAVVALAGTTLLDARQAPSTSGEARAVVPLQDLLEDAQRGSDATVAQVSAAGEEAASAAVLSWVEALGEGDGDAAWAAMGAASREELGSKEELEAMMADLAVDYGAWSAAEPEQVLVTPMPSEGEGTLAVVTLVGVLEHEGTSQARADAFPVRIVDGEVALEPFAPAGALEVAVPEPAEDGTAPQVGTSEELVFVVPSGADAPVLRLDDGETVVCGEAEGTELGALDQEPGQRCAYRPEGGFDAGAHVVTVAFLGADGASMTAESLRFHAR